MFYVYLLRSKRFGRFYIGSTDDLRERFRRHNAGKVPSTRPYIPYELIYYEAYNSKRDARTREIELKKHGQQKEQLLSRLADSLQSGLVA